MNAAPPHPHKAPRGRTAAGPRRAAVENLAMLLSAGVDTASALDATAAGVRSRELRRRLTDAAADVQAGQPVWEALAAQRLLSAHQTWLVRIGEESGTLTRHIGAVVDQERREETFQRRLTSALLYPVIVIVIAGAVGLGVSWLILPRLVTVFRSLRVDLPALTQLLLDLGVFLSRNGFWAVPAAALSALILAYIFFGAPRTRWIGQSFLLRMPGFGRLIREVELARLGSVVGSLLQAGVPVPEALAALSESASFHPYPLLYRHLHEQVTAGRTLQEALEAWKGSGRFIPTTVRQVLATAEQSGQLAAATAQLGQAYERRLETTTKDLVAVVEPLMLFLVWIGVVGLAAAVITPIYSVLQGIQR